MYAVLIDAGTRMPTFHTVSSLDRSINQQPTKRTTSAPVGWLRLVTTIYLVLLLFCVCHKEDGVPSPNSTELLDFVATGGNLFIAVGPNDVSDDIREVANACGVEFEAPGAVLVDAARTVDVAVVVPTTTASDDGSGAVSYTHLTLPTIYSV